MLTRGFNDFVILLYFLMTSPTLHRSALALLEGHHLGVLGDVSLTILGRLETNDACATSEEVLLGQTLLSFIGSAVENLVASADKSLNTHLSGLLGDASADHSAT